MFGRKQQIPTTTIPARITCPDCGGEGLTSLGPDGEWCERCGSTGEMAST